MNRFNQTALEDVSILSANEQELSVEEVDQLHDAKETIAEVTEKDATRSMEGEAFEENINNAWDFGPKISKSIFSGRYRSSRHQYQLLLRVDVDGKRPTKRISGDFFRVLGSTVRYFGSFVVNSPILNESSTKLSISGIGTYNYKMDFPKLRIEILRPKPFMQPASANVQFMTTSNQHGPAYACFFESRYFRTVYYEQDYVKGVRPFTSYRTSKLMPDGRVQSLTVPGVYAEAGVEMLNAGKWNEISISKAGSDSKWDNTELHAAMEKQFFLWKDVPQWKVWMLAANLHVRGHRLHGIMFDRKGKQRQGCAVFHAGIGVTSGLRLRDQLFTYSHELGHCFNLFHSFHKKLMKPPMPNRPNSPSFMNYPGKYRRTDGSGGTAAFWNDFRFQFDNQEVIHLRHAFRNNIIMGGNPFGIGAALEDPHAFSDPVEDNSGLKLELEAPKSFALGEPVVIEIKLRTTDMNGKTVHTELHPNMGLVQVGIQKPSGEVVVYEPMLEHFVTPDTTRLDADKPAVYESAYIGYGKDSFNFGQVGSYQIRAVYHALDGSEVVSNVLAFRVRSPLSKDDEEVADLFFGDDQGKLLYLLGSDSEFLKSGNDAFDLMLDKYGKHPMAVYAKLVKGTNLGREFKTFTSTREFRVRKPDNNGCINLLSEVIDASEKDEGIDNITLNTTMCFLANVQKSIGDEDSAKATGKRMVNIFNKKSLNQHVMKLIKTQAEEI